MLTPGAPTPRNAPPLAPFDFARGAPSRVEGQGPNPCFAPSLAHWLYGVDEESDSSARRAPCCLRTFVVTEAHDGELM